MYDSLQKNEEKTDDKAKIKKSTMKDDKQSDLVTTATKSKSSITTGTSNKWLSIKLGLLINKQNILISFFIEFKIILKSLKV
jgi:hypothetical protein